MVHAFESDTNSSPWLGVQLPAPKTDTNEVPEHLLRSARVLVHDKDTPYCK